MSDIAMDSSFTHHTISQITPHQAMHPSTTSNNDTYIGTNFNVTNKPPLSSSYTDIQTLASSSTQSTSSSYKGTKPREDPLRSSSVVSQSRQYPPQQLTRYSSPDEVLKRFSNKWNRERSATGSGNQSGSETPVMEERKFDASFYDSNGSINMNELVNGKGDNSLGNSFNRTELHHLRNINSDLQCRLKNCEDTLSDKIKDVQSTVAQHQDALSKLATENDNLKRQQSSMEKLIEELQSKVREMEYLYHKNHALGAIPLPTESLTTASATPYDQIIAKLQEKMTSQESEIKWLKTVMEETSTKHDEDLRERERRRQSESALNSTPHSLYQPNHSDFEGTKHSYDNSHRDREGQRRFEPPPIHPMITKMTMKRKRNATLQSTSETAVGRRSLSNDNERDPEGVMEPSSPQHSLNNKNKYSVYVFGRRVEPSSEEVDARSPTTTLSHQAKLTNDNLFDRSLEDEEDAIAGLRGAPVSSSYYRSGSPQRMRPFSLRDRPSSAGGGANENSLQAYRSSSLSRRVEWADEKSPGEAKPHQDMEWTPEREAELKSRVDKLLQRSNFHFPKQEDPSAAEGTSHMMINPRRKANPESSKADLPPREETIHHKTYHSTGLGSLSSFPNGNTSTFERSAHQKRHGRDDGKSKPPPYENNKDKDVSNEARRFADQLIAKYVGNGTL